MASDSHEIKITSDLTENIKHTVEGPPDLEAAVRSHLKSLRGEGNIPGTEEASSTESLKITPQIPVSEAFGKGGAFGEAEQPPAAGSGDFSDLPVSALNKIIKSGAAEALTAPALTAKTASSLAPAGAAAGGLAGVADSVAGALSSVAGAAGALLAPFAALLAEVGLVAAAIAGFAGALSVATEFIDSLFQKMASNFESISPQAQMAKGVGEATLVAKRLRTENRVGDDIANVTRARTDLQSTFIGLSATVIEIIGPALKVLMETTAAILEVINLLLRAVDWLATLGQWILKHLGTFIEFVRSVLSGDIPEFTPTKNKIIGPDFLKTRDLFEQQGLVSDKMQLRDNAQLPNGPFDINL